jgi:hypothetical protein
MVWVVVPAFLGALVGAMAGGIAAGIVVFGILELDGPDADAMAVTIGCVAAGTITLVGAIAGAAAAIVWAIDTKRPEQPGPTRFGDYADDLR